MSALQSGSACRPTDAGSAINPGVLALTCLCLAVAVGAVTWKAWDMLGPSRRPMLQGWNDSFYYFWLPAVVIDHDLDFSRPLATSRTILPTARAAGLSQPRTATGLLPNKYPPGWAVGSLPFFLVAHAVAPGGSRGFEPLYLFAVWFGQMLYAGLGVWLAIRIIRRVVPGSPAAPAVLCVWLASPLVYYQTARVSLSHSQVFVLAMIVFWQTLQIIGGDDRGRTWASLGFAGSLMVVTRNITVVYLLFPAVLLARRRLVRLRRVAWLLGGAAIPAAVQLIAWKRLFGCWIAYSYGDERFDFAHLHLGDVLFSPWHGLFYWHPLLLAGIAALLLWSLGNLVGRPWLLSFAAVVVLNAAWPCWWFASSFGNRGFEVPVFFAMVGIAALLRATEATPRLGVFVRRTIAAAVAWNLVLFVLFLTRQIPQEQPVTFADTLHALARCVRGIGA